MSRTAKSTSDFGAVPHVLGAFHAGEPVLVHDLNDREGKTDFVYPAGAVGLADAARVHNDAGDLAYVVLPNDVSESLGLPFMDDVPDHPAASSHDLAYDSRSSFSFTVNRRDPFTDITGCDRAMTISWLTSVAEAVRADECDADNFDGELRAPSHVHLLRGAPSLLSDRQGHTELGLALADETDISPTVVVCEMSDDETDVALPKDATRDYANRHGSTFIDGDGLTDELV